MHPICVVLFTLVLDQVHSDTHFYRSFHTAVSHPGNGIPQYIVTSYVDDFLIGVYTSDSRVFQPKTKWIEDVISPSLWERNTKIGQGEEKVYLRNIKTMMTYFNQTRGFHALQVLYGCELQEDGSTLGYYQDGYDGNNILSSDKDRVTWVSTMHEAHIRTQRLNPDISEMETEHQNLDHDCIAWLKKFINHGKEEMNKKVHPKVKVLGWESDGVVKLSCVIYSFYPRAIDVKWVQNDRDEIYSYEAKQILPNPDGTYQTKVTVEVTPKEGDTFSCHIDHSSFDEIVIIPWEPQKGRRLYMTIVAVTVAAVALLGILVNKKYSGCCQTLNREEHN